jgi:hypothetical protein
MSAAKSYVLDANVFIGAHQVYYSFDTCPGFWHALVRQHQAKRVCSIDKVKAELIGLEDRLKEWVQQTAPSTFFKGTADQNVIDAYVQMVNWVQNQPQFTPDAKAEFATVADGWVVAYAKANGLVVVTHEEYAPDSKKKVPIPNICIEFGVDYCNTFEMLKDLKQQFVLRHRRTS